MGNVHEDMQRCGVNEESKGPVFLLWKINGRLGFCEDNRKLNDVIKKDYLPLPRIDNTLGSLAEVRCLCTESEERLLASGSKP
jgi:hypothetical protein